MSEVTGNYSNTQIREDREKGNIIIDPFNPSHLQGASYDVTLGEYYYTVRKKNEAKAAVYNPADPEHIANHFEGPFVAKTVGELAVERQIENPKGIPEDTRAIILLPGHRILAHTQEFIGIIQGTSSMHARSTVARNGVEVCSDAGLGDPGFYNRWAMEIYNKNLEDPIWLYISQRIAQIAFHHTGFVESEYSKLSGHYQDSKAKDVATLKNIWVPQMILPKPITLD